MSKARAQRRIGPTAAGFQFSAPVLHCGFGVASAPASRIIETKPELLP
jgi:hypothetical protein